MYENNNNEPEYPSAKHVLEFLMNDEKFFHEGGYFADVKPSAEDKIKIKAAVDKVEGNFKWPEKIDMEQRIKEAPFIPVELVYQRTSFMMMKTGIGASIGRGSLREERNCR